MVQQVSQIEFLNESWPCRDPTETCVRFPSLTIMHAEFVLPSSIPPVLIELFLETYSNASWHIWPFDFLFWLLCQSRM